MFRSIKYLRPKADSNIGTTGVIVLRDSCFGEVRFKRNTIYDLQTNFLYLVLKTYSQRRLNLISNFVKCLRYLYREHGIKMTTLISAAEPAINILLPSVNFSRYVPLIKKFYIPKILRE